MDPDPHSNSGSGSRIAEINYGNSEKQKAGCSVLRADAVSCSLSVLFVLIEISKLNFLQMIRIIKFSVVNCFFNAPNTQFFGLHN